MLTNKTRQKLRRILAIIMVAAMILSVFGTLIYNLVLPMYALESVDPEADKKPIRIGLMYGSNVTVGFETDAPYGFFINRVNRTGDLTHEFLWELDQTKVSCIVDANLSKSAMTYSKTSDPSKTVIGGYHAELSMDITAGLDYSNTADIINSLSPILDELGVYAIPSYIDGTYRIRAGHFASRSDAAALCDFLTEATFVDWTVASPTNTAVALVDPYTDRLLFEYDDADVTAIGLTARPSPSGETAYLVTPAQKLYDGVFMFRRYITDTVDGVSLTDVIPVGEYVKGVLPYEINSSWPMEAQKAFAIVVRSFSLSGKHNHENAYQVDLCNTTHCQVYNGRARITDIVERAVDETAGLVMASGSEIVTAFYSAVTGGCTVGVDDAWGGSAQPHLVAVETPWEIYTNHSYGAWTKEISPTELLTYLRDTKGYSNLRGKIESISIDKLAKNSTYVYQLTLTDSYGTKVTVKTTDGVRNALSKYVNSSNFVVGRGKVVADQTTFSTIASDSLKVRDAYGSLPIDSKAKMNVLTASGNVTASLEAGSVITRNGTRNLTGTTAETETVTVYASNSDNFIFVGKGWGHGVGLSQIGVRDLANLGYSATEILPKYFTNIEIVDWRLVR